MKKEAILIFLVLGTILIFGGFFYLKKPSQETKPPSEKTECQFEIKEVYFKESDDPQNPILIIKGIVGPFGFYKYKIHFPPQEKTAQGIGPIEVGRDEPCKDEKMCKPLDPCQEFQTQDSIARSYPDNVPEFGKNYFVKITFYLNDGTEKNWEGEVDWEKISGGEKELPMTRGASEIGEANVSFPAQPSPGAVDLAIQNVWVHYLVTTDGRHYDFKKTAPNVFVWAWVDNLKKQEEVVGVGVD